MKYTITGGAGNIAKPLAESLLAAGHQVTVIGRNIANLKDLIDKGANPAIGSVEDVEFLTTAFRGSDAVYLTIPPAFPTSDWKGLIEKIGIGYAEAIKASGVKNVVNLSSIGAHLEDGAGPITGLGRTEKALNNLKDVNILHLRPSFFYTNFLSNVEMVKNMNIIGNNFSLEGKELPLVDPVDIAVFAAEQLKTLSFKGHSIAYVVSDIVSTTELAKEFGKAIGKPDLPWVEFTDAQAKDGMLGVGLPEEVAKNFVEMGSAMNNGSISEDYWRHDAPVVGKVKLADFAKKFAAVYNSN